MELNYLCTSCTTRSGSCTGEEKARVEDIIKMEMRSKRERGAIFFFLLLVFGTSGEGIVREIVADFAGYKGIKSREERRD